MIHTAGKVFDTTRFGEIRWEFVNSESDMLYVKLLIKV